MSTLAYTYSRPGSKDQAVKTFQKSLEVNPNQERIKKLISEIKS